MIHPWEAGSSYINYQSRQSPTDMSTGHPNIDKCSLRFSSQDEAESLEEPGVVHNHKEIVSSDLLELAHMNFAAMKTAWTRPIQTQSTEVPHRTREMGRGPQPQPRNYW